MGLLFLTYVNDSILIIYGVTMPLDYNSSGTGLLYQIVMNNYKWQGYAHLQLINKMFKIL